MLQLYITAIILLFTLSAVPIKTVKTTTLQYIQISVENQKISIFHNCHKSEAVLTANTLKLLTKLQC
jgi:hypothetical protein